MTDSRSMTNEVRRAARSRWVIGAAFLAVLLLALSYSRAWPLTIDIGGRDARFISQAGPGAVAQGFHAVENFGGTRVRWTTGDATIALPRPPDGRPALMALRLLNSRPAGQPDPRLTLSADGRVLGSFPVPPPVNGPRVYRVMAPGGVRLDWAVRLRIQSDTITLPNDPRPLGIVVDQVTLTPVGSTLPLPLWLLLWGAGLGALAYALPRSIGAGPRPALAMALGSGALVAWGIAARPLEVLPFVQRLAALIGVILGGVWIARTLAPPQADRQRGLLVRGADLPIYLAVAWWMGPVFQLAMTADGASNVLPAPATLWVGGTLLLLLAGLLGWRWLAPQAAARHRPHLFRNLALAILAAAAAVHLASLIQFAFTRSGPDFWILFRGAREWARGGSLYDLDAIVTNHFGHVFKVPPFYGMLFTPFVFQDGLRVLFFHRVINVLLLAAMALMWLRMFGLRPLSAAGAGVIVLLNARAFADTIAFGQIDLALLLILALALWALREEQYFWAGGLTALGTLFKIYPVLLLAFFVVRRNWRALIGFALGMIILNGVAVAVMGWEMHRVYLFEVLPRIGGTTAWVENQTIAGFVARLTSPPTEAGIFQQRTLSLIAQALSALAALAACYLALQPAKPKTAAYALQYSQFLLLMVLAVPAAWMHYEALLFVPFGALLLHERARDVRLARAVAIAASFALIAYGNQWSFYDGTVMGILTIAGISYKCYGMLLLGGIIAQSLLAEHVPLIERVPRLRPGEPGPEEIASPR